MFTGVTLVTLAAGIGANTAIFSVINGVLLKPLPYAHSEQLVAIWHSSPALNIKELPSSPAVYFTSREESRTLQDNGLWGPDTASITGLAQPEQVRTLRVTDGVLPILEIHPSLGRWFSRKDDQPGSPETVVLAYGYWQSRFGGDASAIGRRIIVDGEACEVIGVLPKDFSVHGPESVADPAIPVRSKQNIRRAVQLPRNRAAETRSHTGAGQRRHGAHVSASRCENFHRLRDTASRCSKMRGLKPICDR